MAIVSYDKDFDRLGVKRLEPRNFMISAHLYLHLLLKYLLIKQHWLYIGLLRLMFQSIDKQAFYKVVTLI